MSKAEHTLELWEAHNTAGHDIHGQAVVYDATGKYVALVYDGVVHAQLIAAAPKLLDALQEIADNCETFAKTDNMAERLHNIARAAINKATSKEKL